MTTDPLEIAAQIVLLAASGLFDREWYLAQYPEVPGDPLVDFCNHGWARGRRPNAWFDTVFYLERCEDVRLAGINPLGHYYQYGEPEGRSPSAAFDPVVYRAEHRVVGSCLAHYLAALRGPPVPVAKQAAKQAAEQADRGMAAAAEQVHRSGLFDVNYYLINYPDVRASESPPIAHFIAYGWREGRRPNPYFDPAWYAATYLAGDPEVDPLLDYISAGEQAGRRPIVYFDPAWYRAHYGLEAAVSPLGHFMEHRRSQQFSPTPWFDANWYMKKHGDLVGPNRDPFAHYLRVGISGEVNPGPTFDAIAYRSNRMPRRPGRANPVAGAEVHERLRREALNPLVHFLQFLLREDVAPAAWAAE